MGLTDPSLIVVLGVLALALFVLIVAGRPRWGGVVARGAVRGTQVVVLNLLVVAVCGALLNDQYLFYSSWSDALGARSSSVALHNGGSNHGRRGGHGSRARSQRPGQAVVPATPAATGGSAAVVRGGRPGGGRRR